MSRWMLHQLSNSSKVHSYREVNSVAYGLAKSALNGYFLQDISILEEPPPVVQTTLAADQQAEPSKRLVSAATFGPRRPNCCNVLSNSIDLPISVATFLCTSDHMSLRWPLLPVLLIVINEMFLSFLTKKVICSFCILFHVPHYIFCV